jgi:hypothetical protein
LTRSPTTAAPLLLALAAAALVVPTTSSAASAACVPGTTTVAGKKAMRFCGPAKAKATLGTKTFAFSGGECSVAGVYFTVNIGTILIHRTAHSKPGPSPYFGVTVTPSGPGVHLGQVLSWTSGGKGYSLLGTKITLADGLKSGSFTGRSLDGKKVKGTFTCE